MKCQCYRVALLAVSQCRAPHLCHFYTFALLNEEIQVHSTPDECPGRNQPKATQLEVRRSARALATNQLSPYHRKKATVYCADPVNCNLHRTFQEGVSHIPDL